MNTKHIIEMMRGAEFSLREMNEILEFMLIRAGKNVTADRLKLYFDAMKDDGIAPSDGLK